MYSYRHAFHAGNHADVLKHVVLIATLRHLTQKETPLLVVDTHAGAGLYRLDGEQAATSGEAADGIVRLQAAATGALPDAPAEVAPALQDYLELVAGFNPAGGLKIYPGSPFVIQRLLRAGGRDRLKLFEMHPTDSRALAAHVAQLRAGRQVSVARQDGFESLKAVLPPPLRRALVLVDPSYEIKTDYAKVAAALQDGLRRFATGTYAVWHPIIPRPEAHELPRRLKTLANNARRPWLHATLTVKSGKNATGLPASGMFLVNPPHTLKAQLQAALPQLVQWLAQDASASHTLDSAG